MNSQDLSNLQEAYLDVYELDEGKVKLDQKRRSRMGMQIQRKLGRANNYYKASRSAFMPKEIRKSLQNDGDRYVSHAVNIRDAIKAAQKKAAQKEEVDLYDIILSHLLDEGYADTPEAAEKIMVNMSEDWKESIVEAEIS